MELSKNDAEKHAQLKTHIKNGNLLPYIINDLRLIIAKIPAKLTISRQDNI